MSVKAFTCTNVGLLRSNNEDSYHMGQDPAGMQENLFCVADGMGGHAGGATASKVLCDDLRDKFSEFSGTISVDREDDNRLFTELEEIIYGIHTKLLTLGHQNPALTGMGTTLSALIIRQHRALIAHVGDSRIYLWRKAQLRQLTEDHTEVQRLVKLERMSQEEARVHHLRHVLSQAVGGKIDSLSSIDTMSVDVEPGDWFLLCTDGLYDLVSDSVISDVLKQSEGPGEAVENLITEALNNGGKDNVTAQLVCAWEPR